MPEGRTERRPRLACEIVAARVLAARASEDSSAIEAQVSLPLPAGGVTPSLATANIADSSAVAAVVREAFAAVGGRSRDVIAVIPDAAVRVMLLDFDSLPETRDEIDGIVRLRLKKALPFDLDQGKLSFHVQRSAKGVKALVCAAMTSVVQEYENAFTSAGLLPGIVVPSSLAALGLVDTDRPTLVLNLYDRRASIAIVDHLEVQLFRMLDVGLMSDPDRIMDQIHPSLVFFEDEFGASVERVLVSGEGSASALAQHFKGQRLEIEQLLAARYLSSNLPSAGAQQLAGVVGALVA